ncbi:MAG TPA: glycosyltransferase family 2 protein [Cyclobacteriaceae bacterium]
MVHGKKVVVVLPAFNAERTLQKTYDEIPFDVVDEVILTDDASTDATLSVAGKLNINHIIRHDKNKGYGSNQKTCYLKALEIGADIIIMLHPDYQYSPKLIPSMADLIATHTYSIVLGSRILGKGALKGGMPLYKFIANRALTFFQNMLLNAKLSEYHTGYRAFDATILRYVNFESNADDFVFDNQFLAQVIYAGYDIAEITCPARYFEEASSINFIDSMVYGVGVLKVSIQFLLQRLQLASFKIFQLKDMPVKKLAPLKEAQTSANKIVVEI